MPSTTAITKTNGARSVNIVASQNGNTTTTRQGATVLAQQKTIERTWVRTPNFAKLKKLKRLPTQPYSYSRVTDTKLVGTHQVSIVMASSKQSQTTTTWGTIDGYFFVNPSEGLSPISSAREAQLDASAINDLLLEAKGMKVNLAQAYAERQQTVNLLGDAAIRIAEALKQCRKGNVVKAGIALGVKFSRKTRRVARNHLAAEDVGSAWLAMQYGWKPLLSDVYGSAETLAQSKTIQLKSRISRTKKLHATTLLPLVKGSFSGNQHVVEDLTIKYTCRFSSYGSVLPTLTQVGLTNPLLIAWELMPWSFVIDWFIPIGSYISSLDATLGLNFIDGGRTVVRDRKTTDVWTSCKHTDYWPGTTTFSGTRKIDRLTITRAKLNGWPSPKLPAFKNPLSFAHLSNALALLSVSGRR